MRGGEARRLRPVGSVILLAFLVALPTLLVSPGEAHEGRHGFLGAGILEAEDYDFPDDDCDPAPLQESHRHTHTEIGSTPPVGTGVWLPWRGCSITWTDVHFARPFQFTMARAESLHDTHPQANPIYTKITHSVFVNGVLHARGTAWSDYYTVQYPPPENIPLTAFDTIPRGTHDIRLKVDLQLNVPQGSVQNYFVDRIAGVFTEPAEPPTAGPCPNLPPVPGVLGNNGMASGSAGWWKESYRFMFEQRAIDPEGDRVLYTWDWGDGSTSTTYKRFASHKYTSIADRAVTVTLGDDASDRCTDTPAAEAQVGPDPFHVTGLWQALLTSPRDGTQCTRVGEYHATSVNLVSGFCVVRGAATANGHEELVDRMTFALHRSNGYTTFGTDNTAPYQATYVSLSQPIGSGYTFRVCAHSPPDDIFDKRFCREGFRFINLWP